MNKVFADTYWVTYGIWAGERPKLIERAWLTSTLPPFYRGVGIQIRFGRRSLKFGVCYPRMPVTVDEYVWVNPIEEKANIDAMVGHEIGEGKEARTWGFSQSDDSEQRASSPAD